MNAARDGLNPVAIVALVAIVIVMMKGQSEKNSPIPVPDDPPSAVALEIRSALSNSPKGTAQAYGAFYDACAATLETDSAPVGKLRVRMERAKALLQLSAPTEFGDIVVRELAAFEEGAIDKNVYAAAFRKLANDCRRADR